MNLPLGSKHLDDLPPRNLIEVGKDWLHNCVVPRTLLTHHTGHLNDVDFELDAEAMIKCRWTVCLLAK